MKNGGLHDLDRTKEVLADGTDIVILGRGPLADPDFPNKLSRNALPSEFDSAILGPIANIKDSDPALMASHNPRS